jgi:RecA/RadA recombinase
MSRLGCLGDLARIGNSQVFTRQSRLAYPAIGDRARLGYPGRVSSDSLPKSGGAAGIALTAMQVDVTTRLGAHSPATATGFASLDGMLSGGLRSGTVLAIAGAPGVGRTAFALLMAYMAARAKAGVVFASASLDATEVMARLAARALHREYPDAHTPYGMIWSGQAWQDAATHRAVADSVETVVKKVGAQLHLYRASGLESTNSLAECASQQWSRHERAVLVVDDIEAFSSTGDGSIAHAAAANGSMEGRVTSVAYDLRRIADQGCAVIFTTLARHAELIAPAVTLAGELREVPNAPRENDARSMEFAVYKNRIGEAGVVPLRFVPGAGLFEEQPPRA